MHKLNTTRKGLLYAAKLEEGVDLVAGYTEKSKRISMKTDKELIKQAKDLCQKFVNEIESGTYRSKKTYADCKAFLDNFKTDDINSCYKCGEKCDDSGNCVNDSCKSFGKFGVF
jgi:uncharacterized protein (UPF0210 family)